MAAAIPDVLRPRLGRFVRLLASDQPGEVVAAAAALKRALAGCGADLNDLGDAIEHPAERAVVVEREGPARPRQGRGARAGDVMLDGPQRRAVVLALTRGRIKNSMTDWERQFSRSINERFLFGDGQLSAKQAETLRRLLVKIGESAAWA